MTSTTADRARAANRLETPEDYAGYAVYGPGGEKVGRVKELFVSADDGVEYLDVKTGLLGLRSVLVPVKAIAKDGERHVLVLR